MDAVIDGGDYSFFGKDFELDSYWHMIEDEWADKPLFVTVGNHETLELKCNELVRYHCDHLHQHGMVPADYSKLFYEGEVNGCHVIVLAQYSDTYTVTGYKGMWIHAGEIKPEQIDYLRERLDRYCGQGKPVFLVIHNSVRKLLDRQSQGNYREHSVIIRENGLYDVLRSHPDVVLCTGHVHHGFGGGAGAAVLGYQMFAHVKVRVAMWRNPWSDPTDKGYQIIQALLAIGSGGLFGMGMGQGRQKFAYLPYPESDFIFAIVGEDFGLIGCLTVIALFVLFVLAGLRVSLACRDRFGCLLGAGITSMIGLQAFINMGVVTGMLPTTGLPLPFFSAGGTSVSVMMAAVGVLLSISRENGARIVEPTEQQSGGRA